MQEPGKIQKRINIPFLEGVNSLVGFNIAKKTEFFHAENARSKTIGTIEKREGQTVLGTNSSGAVFKTASNDGLFSFQNDNNKGLYRISRDEDSTLNPSPSASRSPSSSVSRSPSSSASPSSSTSPSSSVSASYSPSSSASPSSSVSPSESSSASYSPSSSISASYSPSSSSSPSSSTSPSASPSAGTNYTTIYYLNNSTRWTPLTGEGTDIISGTFSHTYAEGSVFLSNLNDTNRYISSNGTSVTDSTTATGHLYNTPRASKINFYKGRLYLADFIYSENRYKTTVLRSSYPMGIVSLVNADYNSDASTTVEVTDNKYFYTDSGANSYEIYRGTTLITTITVTTINETSVIVTGTITGILASDEIWITGTYSGSKVFRWVNNPSITGKDVKQYDTFKLSGSENDPITMLTNIGNVQIISNKNTLMSWNDYTLENFDLDIGCVSKRGYVKTLGTLYFLHYNGIYGTSGGIPKLMSNKVEKYITGATKSGKEACAAGKKGRSVFFTLGDVTLYKGDGSVDKVLSDVCLERNLVQENWYVHTNVKADQFATYVETTDSDRLEFTDTAEDFAVKEFLSGETDDGEEIHFRVDTMKLTVQPTNFEYGSKMISVLAETERGSAMQVFVNLENEEEYYPLEGNLTKGLSVIKFSDKDSRRGKPPFGRLVSLSIRDSSKQLCKLSRITLIHLPTTEEDVNKDNE